MSVINFYLGLIAAAIAVRYRRCLSLSFLSGSKGALYRLYGKESKKGRETREREGHRGGGPAALLYPCLIPPLPLVTSIPFGVPQEP